jgi:hypothetical protein
MLSDLDKVVWYHQETKHRFNAYARGPGRLDWSNQPNPFRRYLGSPLIHLKMDDLDGLEDVKHRILDLESVSKLLYNSMAISAWKSYGNSIWSLRVNPSSGNLHPTEVYLISGPIPRITENPAIFHYAPDEHILELLAWIDQTEWSHLDIPKNTFLIALSSIYWRESWKYGERAFGIVCWIVVTQ